MRKGQAAMEFLMTYGWAILVVLVAIGALAYFGVLSPSRFLPSSCTIAPGVGCSSYKADTTAGAVANVALTLVNGMGASFTTSVLTLTEADGTECTMILPAAGGQAQTIVDGSSLATTWDCSDMNLGDRFKGDLSIVYEKEGETIDHSMNGTLVTKVEAV